MKSNIKEFPKDKLAKPEEETPEVLQHTEDYLMHQIFYTDQPMREIDDLATGGKRNRRWGMVVSLAAIPGYDQVPVNMGPTLIPTAPTKFFTADSIEDLRDRVMMEVDRALEMARLAIEDPEEFERRSMERARRMAAEIAAARGVVEEDIEKE